MLHNHCLFNINYDKTIRLAILSVKFEVNKQYARKHFITLMLGSQSDTLCVNTNCAGAKAPTRFKQEKRKQ